MPIFLAHNTLFCLFTFYKIHPLSSAYPSRFFTGERVTDYCHESCEREKKAKQKMNVWFQQLSIIA